MMKTLQEFLQALKTSDILFIVEGKKDEKSLKLLGVKNILALNRKPLFEFAESIKFEEVAILTDLDPEGKKLYSKLKSSFDKLGIKGNNKFRNFLFKETNLKEIEGLYSFIVKQNVFIG